jgi:hypothetical protein
MNKDLKTFLTGALTGIFIFPAVALISGICLAIFPYVMDDAGGGGRVSRCDAIDYLMAPLIAPIWIGSALTDLIHGNFGSRQPFIIEVLPWLFGYLFTGLIFGAVFLAIRRIFLLLKPRKHAKHDK